MEWDDLSDLNQMEMESVKEWEMQFKGNISINSDPVKHNKANSIHFTEKYILVGRLLKPGDVSTNYSDEESSEDTKKDE